MESAAASNAEVRSLIGATAASRDQLESAQAELAAVRAEVAAVRAEVAHVGQAAAANHERNLLALRMVRDDDVAARATLWDLRAQNEYDAAFEEAEPLVSILIPTYLNWPLLRDRSLPSVLAQTYEHWEAVVVGDAAPDETRRVVESFGDKRIRFVNLPYRGPYPEDKYEAWLVSGTPPFNTALALAQGTWIGANADDDALRPNYVESLLSHAQENRAEVAYGTIHQREPEGPGRYLGVFPPKHSNWGIQASLFHGGLRFLPMQLNDWVFGVPNDTSLLERMLRIGVRFSMLEETVVDYFPSQLWSKPEARLSPRDLF